MTTSELIPPGAAPLLVLGKITEILDAFSLERPTLTLREIRDSTGLPASTVQRLVANMVWAGLLERADDQVRIGLRMTYWAAPALKALDAIDRIKPILDDLRDLTQESVSLFKVEKGHRVCVALSETRHELRQEAYVGKLMPLHAGAAARVLLAWNAGLQDEILARDVDRLTGFTITEGEQLRAAVEQCRAQGYASTSGERIDGAAGLAAPVFDAEGRALYALTVSGPAVRVTPEATVEWAPALLEASRAATRQLGGHPPTFVTSNR